MSARTVSFPAYPAARLRPRPGRLRRAWAALWAVAAVLTALFVLAYYLWPPRLGPEDARLELALRVVLFVGCVGAWALARRPAGPAGDRRRALAFGLAGEEAVGRYLAEHLTAEYVVLNNLALPGGAADADHVVVGPTGVFVLETKNLAGAIGWDPRSGWQRLKTGRAGGQYQARIGDPDAQVARTIHAVRALLERRAPDLCGRTQLWIEGVVVFPHPDARLEAGSGRFPAVRPAEAVRMIRAHRPRRRLSPSEVDGLARALAEEPAARPAHPGFAQRGQALVEVALVVPLLLMLAFGVVGVGRVVHARMGVAGVAREAARAGALADTAAEARDRGMARGQEVAAGYRLDNGSFQLAVEPGSFARGGRVRAVARYDVNLGDLPLLGWARVPLETTHVERIELYRSRWSTGGSP